MKASTIRFHEVGPPGVLRYEALEFSAPGAGEILVRIKDIGLNRAEAAFRSGEYIEAPVLPARLGYEASGVVEALGSGATGLCVGDPVCILPTFSMNQYGVYAERAIVPYRSIVKKRTQLDAFESAALWMAFLTAYGGLVEIHRLSAGDTACVRGFEQRGHCSNSDRQYAGRNPGCSHPRRC